MATPQSALTSPIPSSAFPQQTCQSPNGDFSSLDFLSFIETDGSTPQPETNGSPHIVHPPPHQNESGPSNVSAHSAGSSSGSRRHSVDSDRPSGRGRARERGTKPRGGAPKSSSRHNAKEVDHQLQVQGPYGMNQGGPEEMEAMMGAGNYGLSGGEGFDAAQAGLLQQQLEHIHMQSPVIFDSSHPQSPYHTIAQMYLNSSGQSRPAQQYDMQGAHQLTHQSNGDGEDRGDQRKWRVPDDMAGILTPAPSGDMFPQMRPGLMSPMQLEVLARTEGMGAYPDFNVIPLLSPALSPHANRSAYASPAQNAFPVNSDIQPGSSSHYSRHDPQSRSPIEQLQEQQRQFQEQLILLQNQQRELQASAAAVAAASTSPYIPSSGPSSGHTRLTNSPGLNGAHSGSASTPSPGNFSPLTSPALEASARAVHFNQHQGFSPVFGSQNQRGPHPLSNFSSPALNPVGSSGGAQQTLSPDLEPQGNTDPEYLSAFVGYLNEQQSLGEGQVQLIYPSPAISSTRQGSLSSPLAEGSSGTGPHRNSLPAKSRPSPMMKPRHHRSHARQSSASALPGHFSVPSSPMAQRYHPSATGMGYLPPAAIDQRGVQQHQQSMQRGPSTSSTPSPVDLSQIMPPPPLPTQNGGRKGITPMTPASLMNLGRANTDVEVGESQPIPTQKRQVTARKSSISPTVGTAKKANYGTKIAPNIGGRRALAMRPAGGIGVRAATKATAAAVTVIPPEGENRRTSHKAAEQKRRDSLKAGFDELRLLLPPINIEALDPESGEPIPGSSAPRLLPKSSLVPDDNPNRGVSKVALLKFSNEHIVRLHEKVDKRDGYIDKLRDEVRRLRVGDGDEVHGDEGEDLLDMDMAEGEEEDFGGPHIEEDEDDQYLDGEGEGEGEGDLDEGMEDEGEVMDELTETRPRRAKSISQASGKGSGRRPGIGGESHSSGMTVTLKSGGKGE